MKKREKGKNANEFNYTFIIDVLPIVSAEIKETNISFDNALYKIRRMASRKGISIGSLWLHVPPEDGKNEQMGHYVDVSECAKSSRLALANAARRLLSFFGTGASSGFLHGDYQYPLHVSHIIHDAEKRERRAAWRGDLDHEFIEPDGPGHCRIHYTVVPYARAAVEAEAERICREEACRLAAEVDADFHLDLPVHLGKSGKPDEWWAAYDFAIRVPKKEEFSMIEESANRLWKAIDWRKIYAELDDEMSVSLYMLINHFIPIRRGGKSKLAENVARDKTH